MKRLFLKAFAVSIVLCSLPLFGQQEGEQDYKIKRLETIYKNLEYNTTAFNDLKRIWNITDPVYVREIYNRFIVKNALRIKGKKPSGEVISQMTKDIYAGTVFIELMKRYYDDEIERLRFFTERKGKTDTTDYFFDPVDDFVYIRQILGENIYEDLKSQFYAFTDLTKTYYDNKLAYDFDIYLHLNEPELMFWSMTTAKKNKYLVSAIGRWGNDHIVLPGWYYPDYFAGVKLKYIDYLLNNEPNNTYSLEVGLGIPARKPNFNYDDEIFGKRLFHTGSNVYLKFQGNPFKLIDSRLKKLELTLAGILSITEYGSKEFGVKYISKFYSNRNALEVFVRYKDMFNVMDFGWLNAGLGVASYDIYPYLLNPELSKLQDIKSSSIGKFKNMAVGEIGISNYSGLLHHNITLQLNYNVTENYGYAGLKTYFMLSNVIGLDFKFFTSYRLTGKALPYYRDDNYIVFSPVIRINY